MKSKLLVLIICLLTGGLAFAAPELSDTQAKQLLEKLWDNDSFHIPLGSFDVWLVETTGRIDLHGKAYQVYQAYAKAGIIVIQEDQCLRDVKTKPRDALLLDTLAGLKEVCINYMNTTGGAVGKMIVEKTPKGEELAQKGGLPQQPDRLIIRTGTLRVDKIVKNEARRKGADNYRLIIVAYKAQWTPEYKQYMAIWGNSLSEDRKAIH